MASKVPETSTNFGGHEWRKIGYDDTYEDAQLLHTLQKRLKKEDDPDYEPDLLDGDSPKQTTAGQYFQKPIFQCPECVRSYKSPVRMANHYRDKHPDKDHRTPYSRYPSHQRDKRHYDYSPPSPSRSPNNNNNNNNNNDDLFPYYGNYDYNHKHHTRHQERERFTANENTQIVTYHNNNNNTHNINNNKLSPKTVSNNILYSNTLPTTTGRTPDTTNSSPSPSISPSSSPSASPLAVVPRSHSPTLSSSYNSPSITPVSPSIPSSSSSKDGRTITVKGRTYECKGIRISSVVDEIKFVECLEKNKQRLHLASIAHSQGLISPEEYSRKQREFVNAFSFF